MDKTVNNQYVIITLIIISVVGLFFRLPGLFLNDLWMDEGLTLVISHWPVWDMLLLPTDPTPFLYYYLHQIFMSADMPVYMIRLISLLCGIASLLLMYKWGSLCFNQKTGLIAMFLLAISTIHIQYSVEARAYSLMFMLTLLMSVTLVAYLSLLKKEEDKRKRYLILLCYGAANVLSFYTHILAAIWICFCNLILLMGVLRSVSPCRYWKEILLLFILMAVLALPGLYRIYMQIGMGDSFQWLEQPDLKGFIFSQADIYLPMGLWDNSYIAGKSMQGKVILALMAIIGILLVFGGFQKKSQMIQTVRETPLETKFLILSYVLVPFLVWVIGFVYRPLLIDRSILFCLPGMLLLVSLLLSKYEKTSLMIILAAILMLYIFSLFAQHVYSKRMDWTSTTEFLEKNVKSGDVILVHPDYLFPAFRHALNSEVNAPVISYKGKTGFLQIEPQFGSDPNWDRVFFEKKLFPGFYSLAEQKDVTEGYPIYHFKDHFAGQIFEVNACNADVKKTFYERADFVTTPKTRIWEDQSKCIFISSYRLVDR